MAKLTLHSKLRTFIYGVIGIVFSSSLLAIEKPEYKLIEKDGAYEIRDYPPMVLIAAPMQEEDKASENQSFRKLFKYISKGNEAKQKIEMTAPVFGAKKEGEKGKMYFVVPKAVVKAGVPLPTDKSLEVVKSEAKRYAVYKYSGRSNIAKRKDAEMLLLKWVQEKKMKTEGLVFWAGYNPPWTLGPFRRNEVFIEIKQ